MAVCTDATNAVDLILDLLDELERVIVDLRRQVDEDERGERD